METTKEDLIKERSKARLKKEAKKKIQTTMIGALSSVEKHFGELWGGSSATPSPEQARMRNIFEELRTEILDKGNAQIRNMDSEIEAYDVNWSGYHMQLPLSPIIKGR